MGWKFGLYMLYGKSSAKQQVYNSIKKWDSSKGVTKSYESYESSESSESSKSAERGLFSGSRSVYYL